MAKVRRNVIGGDPLSWVAYFSQFTSDSFITVDTANNRIYIDETHSCYIYRDSWQYQFYINGTVSTQPAFRSDDTITVAVSDTLFYMHAYNSSQGDQMFVLAQKLDNGLIYKFTFKRDKVNQFIPLDYSWDYIDMYNDSLLYKHSKILNYSTSPNYINYTTDILLLNGIRTYFDNDLIACTSVLSNNIITFGGQNYYSIGTNTLVRINSI